MHDELSVQFENKMYVVHLLVDGKLILQCDVFADQSPMCLLCTFPTFKGPIL
jgi:hypothetical protein